MDAIELLKQYLDDLEKTPYKTLLAEAEQARKDSADSELLGE